MTPNTFIFISLLLQFPEPLTLKTAPPVVVRTVPEAGSMIEADGLKEIRITFSKLMHKGYAGVGTVTGTEAPRLWSGVFSPDGLVCTYKVEVMPGKTYALWFNSPDMSKNVVGAMCDPDHRKLVPYLLVFSTKDR